MTRRKIAAGTAGLALIAAGGVAAVGASGAANSAATDAVVVKQKFSYEMKPNRYIQDNMRFNKDVYRVNSGGTLKLVNNKPQEGPHTVSLVKRRDLPRTANQAFNCKVCNALGKAHGADPNGEEPPEFAFVENGRGQRTPADFDKAGDSGITGPDKGDSFTVDVTAAPGTTRYMLCLLHPWMQAKLKVE
jgi:plastocyanin